MLAVGRVGRQRHRDHVVSRLADAETTLTPGQWPAGRHPPLHSPMDQLEANKSAVRRLLEDFLSCGDPAVADEVLAPEFVDHNPSNPGLPGRDNLKRSVAEWCRAFPDTRTVVDDLIAEADRVAARWTSTATHRGAFLGIPATGRSIRVAGMSLDRIEDGQVAEGFDGWDALGLRQQLGVYEGP